MSEAVSVSEVVSEVRGFLVSEPVPDSEVLISPLSVSESEVTELSLSESLSETISQSVSEPMSELMPELMSEFLSVSADL